MADGQVIENLGSTNGTYVNGERIAGCRKPPRWASRTRFISARSQSQRRGCCRLQRGLDPWSAGGRTPAMAMRLADRVWTACEDNTDPVPVDILERESWAEVRRAGLRSAQEPEKLRRCSPTS